MPFASTAAENLALDRIWANAPGTTVESGLLTSDPRIDGVEVTGPGYARVVVADYSTFWTPAADGVKSSTDVQFADATGDWTTARWEGIWVDGSLFDFAPLSESISVVAGPGPTIRHRRRFNSGLSL